MVSNIEWTADSSKARRNEYDGRCVTCGLSVAATAGRLVSTATPQGVPSTNGTIHADCVPGAGWYYRARNVHKRALEEVKAAAVWEAEPYPTTAEPREFQGSSVEPTPEPEAPREPTEQELQAVAQELLDKTTANFLGAVPDLVRNTLLELTRTVEIKLPKQPSVTIKNAHRVLPDVVMAVVAGTSPFLVGPAGSGKTTIAEQVCQTLKRKFYAENRVTSEYKLLGYMDATGKYVRTQFREAFEKGGGFLLDEVDASDPDVLTTFNSALANRVCPFPDKLVKAHDNFFAIAAGNTYGRGADRQYVGRNQLDAATLDRFVVIEVDYDEAAELTWAIDDDWTTYVQQVRAAVVAEKVRHVVSPRASIYGGRLLAAGMERKLVEERCIWKGLDETNRSRVITRMGSN